MSWWIVAALLTLDASAWPMRGSDGAATDQVVDARTVLAERPFAAARIETDPAAIGRVAAATLVAMRAQREEHPLVIQAGLAGELGVTLEAVEATLAFVAETAATSPESLRDPAFLQEHFRYLSWTGDAAAARRNGVALADGRIRLTRYLVYRRSGSPVRSDAAPYALYAVPGAEHLTRWRRWEVLDGVYEAGGVAAGAAEPLVWLSRQGVHDAIMQGTIAVAMPDGRERLFNVHESNGVPYDRSIRDQERQGRYWYFREVPSVQGWGGVALESRVAVAGDIYNLGFGKLIALSGADGATRLAVLADTGGAFQPNLYQLDFYTGFHDSGAAFQRATEDVPRRVHAGILVLR